MIWVSLWMYTIHRIDLALAANMPEDVSRDQIWAFLKSADYSSTDIHSLLERYLNSRYHANSISWDHELYGIVNEVVKLGEVSKLRDLLTFRYDQHDIFDPTRVLYTILQTASDPDDTVSAKMTRVALGLNADPLRIVNQTTAAEIAISRNKPKLLEALIKSPSPISADAIHMSLKASNHPTLDGDIYATKLIRQAYSVDNGSHQLSDVLKESHYFNYVHFYLTNEVILIGFTLVVFTIVFFLYQLRIKRVPVNSKLMIPRVVGNRNPWWLLLTYSVATILSSVPTSNLFECIGIGLASFGSVVWAQVFIGRTDVSLVLIVCILAQALITLSAYYLFAPTNDSEDSDKYEEEIDPSSHLYRVMFYPKSRDIGQAMTNCAVYLLANSVSFMILFSALDPVHKMYIDSPGASISETYGHSQTLTRTVAMSWDIIIFYCISLRIYRVIDTANVYGSLARSIDQKRRNSLPM